MLNDRDVVRLIEARAGVPTSLRILRAGREMDVPATPDEVDGKGLLGIQLGSTVQIRKYGPWEAFTTSVQQNIKGAALFFDVVGRLLTGRLSVRAVSGPVDIFIFSGEALRRGWETFFNLMALFSLQLGILNLLPIPFLDGGHIAILGVESIIRRDLSDSIKERVLQVGFVFLILLMGIVLFSDIVKNADVLFGWWK